MKQNLKEEIERNRELMGLSINEQGLKDTLSQIYKDKLEPLVNTAKDYIKDKFGIGGDDEEEKEEEEIDVDINALEKDSEEEKKFINKIHKSLNINDISSQSTCNCKNNRLKQTKYFITHHTGGNGDCKGVMNTLNSRGLGVQWIVDREGNVCQTLPLNSKGYHILDSKLGPNNSNSQGVEVSAKNDEDVLPVQAIAVLKLVKKLGLSPSQIYGHGEVNPGHKAASEGQTIKKFIQKNYNSSENNYDFSMFGDRAPEFN
jgi:hypothetical protein